MLNSITSWIYTSNPSNPSQKSEESEDDFKNSDFWEAAIVWQKKQDREHFTVCKIYNNYLLIGDKYNLPENNVTKSVHSKYYYYCFGNFSSFISNDLTFEEVRGTIRSLLNLYDTGKGYSRIILGDPEHITLLKSIVNIYTMQGLREYNFSKFMYDYGKIHAHTMAQYSLSTLIMLITSHLVNMLLKKETGKYDAKNIISSQICKNSYDNKVYQEFEYFFKENNSLTSLTSSTSWPKSVFNCSNCGQICDKLWGDHNCCLNCHINVVCLKCGTNVGIRKNNISSYPYCEDHYS